MWGVDDDSACQWCDDFFELCWVDLPVVFECCVEDLDFSMPVLYVEWIFKEVWSCKNDFISNVENCSEGNADGTSAARGENNAVWVDLNALNF